MWHWVLHNLLTLFEDGVDDDDVYDGADDGVHGDSFSVFILV